MNRVEGWEILLINYLVEAQKLSFQWGCHDCCYFACNGIVVQGIENPMQGLRQYRTAFGAAGMIKRLGGSLNIAATKLAAKVGLHEIDPAFAGRGCPVLTEVETPWGSLELALGLVGINSSEAFFAGKIGLVSRPLSMCQRAWGFD